MKRKHDEASLQRSCVQWLELERPRCYWTATANGEKRDAITGAKLKRMGVRAGAPDFIFCVPPEFFQIGWCGLFAAIELKTDKGRQSDSQKDTEKDINKACGNYVIVRSLEEFIETVVTWGVVG